MDKIVECVPNFSEGKDKAVINAIAAAVKVVNQVKLLNVDPGEDFNRTVFTFAGDPDAVLEAAKNAARIGIPLIDMRFHSGEHARMGALDVMPFIPIKNVTEKECIELSKRFGQWMAEELRVPVFLYAKSALSPDRVNLPSIRKGEYEALEEKFKDSGFHPDFGEPVFVPKSGATATGCRDILLAYNINLGTSDKGIASDIAGKIRTSGIIKKDERGNKILDGGGTPVRIPGKFEGVQAGGMMYDENIAQVSMNLLNYRKVNMHHVYETVKEEAAKYDVSVTGSEIVGLVPKDSLVLAGRFYAEKQKTPFSDDELVMIAVEHLGLSDLYQFNPKEKVIEYMIEESGPLASSTVDGFLTNLASDSPAPGGGSVAALCGALGAALSSMVCQLTIGKEKYQEYEAEIKQVLLSSEKMRDELTLLIDEDTNAFNDVMKAFKMPKETDEQKKKRSEAIQKGYKKAAEVPLKTARLCMSVFDVASAVAEKGNPNSITDAGVSALLSKAGVESALLNVEINLGSIKDEEYVNKISGEIDELRKNTEKRTKEILDVVETKM
jgi:glutamate formiminotransferase/formiminotetrahydrofolate cyclodeaminase